VWTGTIVGKMEMKREEGNGKAGTEMRGGAGKCLMYSWRLWDGSKTGRMDGMENKTLVGWTVERKSDLCLITDDIEALPIPSVLNMRLGHRRGALLHR
jgi:hypothetical protein